MDFFHPLHIIFQCLINKMQYESIFGAVSECLHSNMGRKMIGILHPDFVKMF